MWSDFLVNFINLIVLKRLRSSHEKQFCMINRHFYRCFIGIRIRNHGISNTKKGKLHDCEYYLWPRSDLVEQADELELWGLVLEEGGHKELAVLQLLLLQLWNKRHLLTGVQWFLSGSESGIQCIFDLWIRDPDPGWIFQIIFLSLETVFRVKNT